jgi:cation diffusion facilitator CzcD-associated flavoprotein CzcO
MFTRPAKDAIANFLRAILPEKLAYRITRFKNIKMQDFSFKLARDNPQKVKDALYKKIEAALGPDYDKDSFTPPYNPWEQRLCLVPDEDLFKAMKAGKASVVTGHIAKFEKGGVRLTDGQFLPADIVVTATGLKLAVAGKIDVRVDGEPVKFNERFYYKGCMFSNLPNLAVVFGYLNASWTLRADINSDYVCRVLEHMRTTGSTIATPVLTAAEEAKIVEDDVFDFSSGYIQRGKHIMPRNSIAYPWRLNQEYVVDRKRMKEDPLTDGFLTFTRPGANARRGEEQLEAAE